ncbi:MAG: FAD-binding oxidoreductase [bacterium]|jgi:D-lactate dehydrogenase (cytochrome)|nr:FAD-binding protein [Betaproteobacteria bacterium]
MIEAGTLDSLRALVGDRLQTTQAIREQHSHDESGHAHALPDAVVFVESTEDVCAVLRLASACRMPVVPFGTGTGIEGASIPVRGGLSLDLSRMNRVLSINVDDLDARVQAGVTRLQLNDALKAHGLFFPIDPGADASIGGMASTRASGTNAVRYGTMRENVLGLTVVAASGEVVRTGGRARKSAAGYDLTRLFIGSEGTLGVITEVQLRLYGQPERIVSAVCQFETLEGAVRSVIETIQLGVPVARIELLDTLQMQASIAYSKLDEFVPAPTLFYEFHGSEAGVAEQTATVAELAASHGGGGFRWAEKTEERNRLWKARHAAYYAGLALLPGAHSMVADVCVPISRLAECVLAAQRDSEAAGLVAPIVGHVGDGNFHVTYLARDERERALTTSLHRALVERAIDAGGTCTGEHGIGIGKRGYLAREHGAAAVAAMQAIKQALDPLGIMNPGKVLPDAR